MSCVTYTPGSVHPAELGIGGPLDTSRAEVQSPTTVLIHYDHCYYFHHHYYY